MNQVRRTGRLQFQFLPVKVLVDFLKHALSRFSGAQTNNLLLKSGFWSLSGLTLLIALPSLGWGQGREFDNCDFRTSGTPSFLILRQPQWDSFVVLSASRLQQRYMLVQKTQNELVCCEIPVDRRAIRRNNQFSCYSLQNAEAQRPNSPPAASQPGARPPVATPPASTLPTPPIPQPAQPPAATPAPASQPTPPAIQPPTTTPTRTPSPSPTETPRREGADGGASTPPLASAQNTDLTAPELGTSGPHRPAPTINGPSPSPGSSLQTERPFVTNHSPASPTPSPDTTLHPTTPLGGVPSPTPRGGGAPPPAATPAAGAVDGRPHGAAPQTSPPAATTETADELNINDPCRGAIVTKLYEDWRTANPAPAATRHEFIIWAQQNTSKYKNDYGCGRRRENFLTGVEVGSQATDMAVNTTSQILGAIATQNTQTAANQNTAELHQTARNEQADAYEKLAWTQGISSALHLGGMVTASVHSNDLRKSSNAAEESLSHRGHNLTVGQTVAAAGGAPQNLTVNQRTAIVGSALHSGPITTQEQLTTLETEGRRELSESQDKAETMKGRATTLAITESVKMATAAASAVMYAMQASDLRKNNEDSRPSDDTVTPFLAGGDHTAPTDRGPLSGPTFTNVGSGDLAVSEATENRDNLPPPPGETLGPMGGGGGSPGGLAGPVSSGGQGGVITAGTTSGAGGGPGSAGGGGGGSGDPSSGESGPEAFNATAGAKFADASNGAGFGAAGSGMGARQKSTGMDIQGLLSQFMPKKEEDRQPASNILEFGKNGAPGAAQGGDNEGGILGPNGDPLFVRVSRQTTAQHKSGNIR